MYGESFSFIELISIGFVIIILPALVGISIELIEMTNVPEKKNKRRK